MSYRTRVKVCGITRARDAVVAVDEGVDAIGLVFYAPSPRAIDIDSAQRIARQIPVFVSVVALFVDASPELVRAVIEYRCAGCGESSTMSGRCKSTDCKETGKPRVMTCSQSGKEPHVKPAEKAGKSDSKKKEPKKK